MDDANSPAAEPTVFAATLTPHRSLSRGGMLAVIAAVAAINLVAGMVFMSAGAWPVLPFLGLDVLVVWLAFHVNARAARAYEQVKVTGSELTVRQVAADGAAREWRFNPLWVRLARETHEEFGVMRLALVERGRSLTIGGFLPPSEKASFHDALARALAEARRGPTRTRLD